jgi:PHD/YefM family antitoxin component YafN of YafNO toxin-antitoxin module
MNVTPNRSIKLLSVEISMARTITLIRARARLGRLCEQVVKDETIIFIRRRGKKNVALISATELSG